jgi:hypothetical protein
LQAGIKAARGKYILMGDSDDSYEFGHAGRFLEQVEAGYDLAMGNRFAGGIEPGAMPFLHRYVGNPILTGMLNVLYKGNIGDAHCGLRAFRRDKFLSWGVITPGMEFASEMVIKAMLSGAKFTNVPTILRPDGRNRPPHLRTFRDGWRHLRLLLIMCPFWLYLIPASLFIATGTGLMTWLAGGDRFIGSVGFGVHSLYMASLISIVGWQVLWLFGFAKIHGWTSGLLPNKTLTPSVFKYLNLETGMIAGTLMLLFGMSMVGWMFASWAAADFGALNVQLEMRKAVFAGIAFVMGVQTIFGSFLMSMMSVRPLAAAAEIANTTESKMTQYEAA